MKNDKAKIISIYLITLSVLFYLIYPSTSQLLFSYVIQKNNEAQTGVNTNKIKPNTFSAAVNNNAYMLNSDRRKFIIDFWKRNFHGFNHSPSRITYLNSFNENDLDVNGNNNVLGSTIDFRYTIQSSASSTVRTLRNPDNPSTTINGLDYCYYQGRFKKMPDISTLTPVKTGKVATFDICPIPRKDDYFISNYSGFINITTDGIYTFYTNSNNGSKLYIGSELIINNDGERNAKDVPGIIGLKSGKHAITVTCIEKNNSQSLEVSYSGSTILKQVIPASALFSLPAVALKDPENPSNTLNGLNYAYYEQINHKITDINNLTPIKTGTVNNFDITPRHRNDQFAFNFSGYINIPSDGLYTFYTNSDDGKKLYIGNQLVIDDNNLHVCQERTGTIGLKSGKHAIAVSFLDNIVIKV